MFLIGILMTVTGLVMLGTAFLVPSAARPGLIPGAAAVGGAGLFLMALGWPGRRKPSRDGMVKADAYVLDARLTGAEVTGYRMVEMTLDVHPKNGMPFQVRRKFVANRSPITPGERLKVYYDPTRPDVIELA